MIYAGLNPLLYTRTQTILLPGSFPSLLEYCWILEFKVHPKIKGLENLKEAKESDYFH